MLRTLTILAVLLTALRLEAASLPALRGELSHAETRLQSVRREQARLRSELDRVAARIEALKRGQPAQDGLFGRGDLDELLKLSQDLSEKLNEQLRAERQAQDDQGRVRDELARSLDAELQSLAGRFASSGSPAARRELLAEMKGLRGEREGLRPGLGAPPVAAAPDGSSEDPEVLLERADALLDAADKLRREEAALAVRVRELEQERELSERLDDFLSEGDLFDDRDRRLAASSGRRGAVSAEAQASPPADVRDPAPTGPNTPAGGSTTPLPGPSETPTAPAPSQTLSSSREGLAGAQLGVSRSSPTLGDDATIEQLSARRAQLRAQAAEAQRRAEELTRNARKLR